MQFDKYIGEKVRASKGRTGEIVSISDNIIVNINGTEVSFVLSAFEDGWLKFIDPKTQAQIQAEIKEKKEKALKEKKEDEKRKREEKERREKEMDGKLYERARSRFCTFRIGNTYKNQDIMKMFVCSSQGGMRRSNTTNSLVLICDHTKPLYDDKWINGLLHYTGMGQRGDQNLYYMQNKTLYESNTIDIEVHLFEVYNPTDYVYRGQVYLAEHPYQEDQIDGAGFKRKVWMFPLALK
ncbi:MAG: hypothetical protein ACOYEE_03540 [Christensenellales bacterium]